MMSDHFLLDTNIISELCKVKPAPQVVKFVAELDRYWLSVITLHELKFGIESMSPGKKRDGLASTLAVLKEKFTLQIIDIDSEIAELAGTYRARARKNGTTLHLADSLIASCCIFSGGLTLATRNTDDFTEYPVQVVNPFML